MPWSRVRWGRRAQSRGCFVGRRWCWYVGSQQPMPVQIRAPTESLAGAGRVVGARGRKSDEVATHNFPGTSSGYLRFLRTQNTAPWRATLGSGRRRAYSTNHCLLPGGPPPGSSVPSLPTALVWSTIPGYFVPLPTYVNPWPVTQYPGPDRPGRLAGRQPARRCLPGEWWNVSPSPRDQPEARTNRHCSVTGQVRRMCENWTYADSEAVRRLV